MSLKLANGLVLEKRHMDINEDVVLILGPGSSKTTFLRCLNSERRMREKWICQAISGLELGFPKETAAKSEKDSLCVSGLLQLVLLNKI